MYKLSFIENENEYALYPVPFPHQTKKTILLIYLPREKTFVFSSRNTLIDNQFIVSAIASITEQKLISLTMSSLKLSCKTTMKRVFF